MENSQLQTDTDEIDLRDIILPVWNRRWFIVKVSAIFGLFGLVLGFLQTPQYTATISFIPQTTEKGGGLGNLGGLAAMAGINLQGMASGSEIPPSIYPKIISSPVFKRRLLEAPLHEPSNSKNNYKQYFEKDTGFNFIGTLTKYTIGLPGELMKLFSKRKSASETSLISDEIIRVTPEENAHFERLGGQLKVEVDKKENSVIMSFTMTDPLLAAQMVQSSYSLFQKELIQYKIELAQQQLTFIEGLYKQKKEAFEASQARLSAFRDQNQNLSSARAINRQEELEAEYNLAFNIYSEFAKQLEQAKIQVSKDTPIFSVIQPVTVPLKKSSMGKSMFLLISLFLGFISATAYIFLRSTLLNKEYWSKTT